MNDDPYRTPQSEPLNSDPDRPRPVLGVVVGFVVDVGGTMIVAVFVGLVFAIVAAGRGIALEEGMSPLLDENPLSAINLAMTAFGLFMSFVGGWVCTRVARARNLWPGVILASLVTLFGLGFMDEAYGIGLFAAMIVAGFAATIFGAWGALEKRGPSA